MSRALWNPFPDRDSADVASATLLEDAPPETLDPAREAELRHTIETTASRILALTSIDVVEELYPDEF